MMKTMKKTYVTPMCDMLWTDESEMLAVSGVESDTGLEYGGVDVDGNADPETRALLFQLINFDF